ncbi:MAG: sigma-70 family RNA polymerase sigma factor [Phycisphaerales bacterium]|nr:sigma-70 family RNA polymerase sigma factor [Phycisphaerales bacterium]
MTTPPDDITVHLHAAAAGEPRAGDRLAEAVYQQLRAAAQARMAGERPDHTLSATALVHEAFIRLAGPRDIPWRNRAHFYAAAAEAMRRILLDHARARRRLKRDMPRAHGVDPQALDAPPTLAAPGSPAADSAAETAEALDAAIARLEAHDPRAAQVVRLKYYAGLGIAEVALALDVSERTVKNDWAFARAWLHRQLAGG